jgi:hypothetical protein
VSKERTGVDQRATSRRVLGILYEDHISHKDRGSFRYQDLGLLLVSIELQFQDLVEERFVLRLSHEEFATSDGQDPAVPQPPLPEAQGKLCQDFNAYFTATKR